MRSRGTRIALVKDSLNYNERKVEQGEAERIHAANFLEEAGELAKSGIKQRFETLMALNQRVEKRAVKITLSFSPADVLDRDKMALIAADYMDRLGFGRQPYVVYRHLDTFTPHMHILTVTIKRNGENIHRRRFGGWPLIPVREAIEKKFGLIREPATPIRVASTPGQRLEYGKKPTTQALAEVVQYVRENYQFRNMAELNAILRQYHVVARAGLPGSRLFEKGGIVYQALDEKGRGKGVPVKGSKLDFSPTLAALRVKFEENRVVNVEALRRVRVEFWMALQGRDAASGGFEKALRRGSLAVAPEVDISSGKNVGLLVVDLAARTVVKGVELGEGFDWEAVKKKLGFDPLERRVVMEKKVDGPELKRGKGMRVGG